MTPLGRPDREMALAVFYRCLATMISSGVSTLGALTLLSEQCEHRRLGQAIGRCAREIRTGKSLSQSMALHPRIFPAVAVAMIRMGEESGALHHILPRLAEQQEKACALRQKLRSALVYPCFTLAVCLIALAILPGLALEPLLRSMRDMDVPLSWPTRTLMTLYSLETSPFTWLLLVPLAFGWRPAMRWLRDNSDARKRLQEIALRVPLLGEVMRLRASIELCRALALLLDTGVPLLKTLDLLKTQTDGYPLRQALSRARAGLIRGDSLGRTLSCEPCLPPLVGQMITLGEDCGKTSDLLGSVVQVCEESLEHNLSVLQASMMPVMLGVLGLFAGFLMLATMSPMVGIAQSL